MPLETAFSPLIEDLKQEIRQARVRAHLSVNKELIQLYWRLGRKIIERKKEKKWGSKVIESISKELRKEFPGMRGLSERNLVYMQTFAQNCDAEFTQQAVA